MPTYLCHGFRWHRHSIRVYVVVQNIDDAAPEWIIAPQSSAAILESFYTLFDFLPEPDQLHLDRSAEKATTQQEGRKRSSSKKNKGLTPVPTLEFSLPSSSVPNEEDAVLINEWSAVKLLEEYDPTNLEEVSRPYAFVADHVVRVDLNVSVAEEIARYEERMAKKSGEDKPMLGTVSDEFVKTTKKGGGSSGGGSLSGKMAGWLEKLRDQLQMNEDIRWYVVVCGDDERAVPEDLAEPEPPRMRGVLDERGGLAETPQRERNSERETPREGGPKDRERDREPETPPVKREWNAAMALHPGPSRSHQGASTGGSQERELPAQSPRRVSGSSEKPAKQGGLRRLFGKKQDDLG
ncbi:hypothetical protein jhhlp_003601 [Lomentospora prolificans]|uniref:Developmental regulator n=1 Tax=Lomentospora prolificans TaxID=41688 RepID=A0A2N3N967_9PEZI|nr:hypothetical protein jhhlp_003601 [Lomentospora prolificans]